MLDIDLRRIPGAHKNIVLVPQWDFLELIATAADAEPAFRLMRSTEVLAPLRAGGKVVGVSYRDPSGVIREMHADLTVACDGRSSTLRQAIDVTPHNLGAPMDTWWFRLPRMPDDPRGLNGAFGAGQGCVVIDRGGLLPDRLHHP